MGVALKFYSCVGGRFTPPWTVFVTFKPGDPFGPNGIGGVMVSG
jgi:hypothetical protein